LIHESPALSGGRRAAKQSLDSSLRPRRFRWPEACALSRCDRATEYRPLRPVPQSAQLLGGAGDWRAPARIKSDGMMP